MSDNHPGVLIVDDFLDEAAWTEVWTHFQFADLAPVTRTAGAWKLGDGVPLGGDELVTPARDEELSDEPVEGRFPSGTALDRVVEALLGEAARFAPLVGDDWAHLTARPYVYPTGSGLSWHGDDSAAYTGAYIYYAHPHWNAHWGGELLVADAPPARTCRSWATASTTRPTPRRSWSRARAASSSRGPTASWSSGARPTWSPRCAPPPGPTCARR